MKIFLGALAYLNTTLGGATRYMARQSRYVVHVEHPPIHLNAEAKFAYTRHEPIGVVGAIIPCKWPPSLSIVTSHLLILMQGIFCVRSIICEARTHTHFTPISRDVCGQDCSWCVLLLLLISSQIHNQFIQHLLVVMPSSNHLMLPHLPRSVLASSSKPPGSRRA